MLSAKTGRLPASNTARSMLPLRARHALIMVLPTLILLLALLLKRKSRQGFAFDLNIQLTVLPAFQNSNQNTPMTLCSSTPTKRATLATSTLYLVAPSQEAPNACSDQAHSSLPTMCYNLVGLSRVAKARDHLLQQSKCLTNSVYKKRDFRLSCFHSGMDSLLRELWIRLGQVDSKKA